MPFGGDFYTQRRNTMKINRFIALALIALLVVGAMGILSYRTIAKTNTVPAPQDCSAETENEGAGEVEDADGVENECGDQSEQDDQTEGEANDANGAKLQGQAAITAEEAEAAVLAKYPGARVLESELENEGGTLLYSFELDNGTEVEVDASDGTILSTTGEEDSD
jgi:uncharacterized membrane protein YkoI